MANELPNAVALMGDSTFREWVKAATCYQARQVIASATGATAANRFATDVILDPVMHLNRWVNVLATDPVICSKGTTVTQITQNTLLAQVAATWQPLAAVLYPVA